MPREFPRCRWHHKKRTSHAVFLGESIAKGLFETFEEHSTEMFSWANFPAMVKRMALLQAPGGYPGSVEDSYYELTASIAFAKAVELSRTKV